MTPEEKELLQRVANQVDENNVILRGMRRSQRLSSIMRVGYWVLILVLSFGAYFAIQPYLNMLGGLGGKVSGSVNQVNQMADLLKDL